MRISNQIIKKISLIFARILEVASEPLCPGTINCKRQTAGKMDLTGSPIPLPLFLSLPILFGHSTVHCNRMPSQLGPEIQQTRLHCIGHSLITILGIPIPGCHLCCMMLLQIPVQVQRFREKCGLLGSEAGKGRPLNFGRMFANVAKTV